MRIAIIQLSKKAIEDFFPFPKGTKLVQVLPENNHVYKPDTIELLVEHDDLEDIQEGDMIPVRTITIERTDKKEEVNVCEVKFDER